MATGNSTFTPSGPVGLSATDSCKLYKRSKHHSSVPQVSGFTLKGAPCVNCHWSEEGPAAACGQRRVVASEGAPWILHTTAVPNCADKDTLMDNKSLTTFWILFSHDTEEFNKPS